MKDIKINLSKKEQEKSDNMVAINKKMFLSKKNCSTAVLREYEKKKRFFKSLFLRKYLFLENTKFFFGDFCF